MRTSGGFQLAWLLAISLALAGCTSATSTPRAESAAAQQPEAARQLEASLTPAVPPPAPTSRPTQSPVAFTPSAAPAAVPSATETLLFSVCSPLEDISLNDLVQPDLLKNPFQPPRPGWDDGHHGVDFAYWSRGEHTSMLGLPVHSVLSGIVAGVIQNRQPYGNAVIIETSLSAFPSELLQTLPIPQPSPTIQPAASLNCPLDPVDYAVRPGRSLYLLYAHLNQAPAVRMGQSVACGQAIGEVGTTGKSVNAHLHLETRAGPSGATFPAMAHYDTSASEQEMRTYCTWRVSGLFEMFDPMSLFH